MDKKVTYYMGGKPYYGVPPVKIEKKSEENRITTNQIQFSNIHQKSKKRLKYDPAYIAYVENGESAAVFITRDIAKDIPTAGKWIDVVECAHEGSFGDGGWDFKYIKVELFPRKIKPEYPEDATDEEKKYITWKTAHLDIGEQKKAGVHGPRYQIIPKLINRNKGKYKIVRAVWNRTFSRWVPEKWFVKSSCEWRDRKIPLKPKWDYEIQSWKRLS